MGDTEYNPLRCEEHTRDLDIIVSRVQKLVDEYHAENVTLEGVKGRIEMLTMRVPVDLPQQLAILTAKHDTLHSDFKLMRSQWYYFIGLICTGFIVGLVTFVVNGGLKP